MGYPGPEPMTSEQYETFRRRQLASARVHAAEARRRLNYSERLDQKDKAVVDALLAIYELMLIIPGLVILPEETERA